MRLSQDQFDTALKRGSLRLALIGMSNIGKSFRARQLQDEKRFELFVVDREIEKRLGISGIEAVARWMGPPYAPAYARAEERYLALEAEVIGGICPKKGNLVVDSTGSIIYLPAPILEDLKKRFLIVHLAIDKSMIGPMTDRFFAHPKPCIWKGMFRKEPKESPEVALRRSYPEWLKFRHTKYKELADVSISGLYSMSPEITCAQFLKAIREALPTK